MDLSLTLAKIIGVYGLIISVSAMLNIERVNILVAEFLDSEALVYIVGIVSLMIGLALVTVHNVTTPDYRLIITVFGWLSFIEGVILLLVPDLAEKVIRGLTGNRGLLLLMVLAFFAASIWLTMEGFGLRQPLMQKLATL